MACKMACGRPGAEVPDPTSGGAQLAEGVIGP